jgi:hypothetical protein
MGAAMAALAVGQAGLQVVGGIQANREARRQSRIAKAEAEERAQARARDVKKFRARQMVNFLKSGVTLEGTPTDVLTETEKLGAQEVSSIRGAGRERARTLRAQGRQALFSGISGALRTGSQAAIAGGSFA